MSDTLGWVGNDLSDGRYRVEDLLGEGGMGYVYRAWDRKLDRAVVIKVPKKSRVEDPKAAKRFSKEIRILAKLPHRFIVPITDTGEEDSLPYSVMEYLSGGSLADRLTNPSARFPLPLDWLPGIASALDFIHAKGYIHRDVKPDNILFDEEGHAFLADFGIIKRLVDEEGTTNLTMSTGTMEGTALGTPGYMSPELIDGLECDGRVDQYALAVTVFEALIGRPPFSGPTLSSIWVAHLTKTAPRLDAEPYHLPRSIADAVAKALSKAPEIRFANCAAFASMIAQPASASKPSSTPFVIPGPTVAPAAAPKIEPRWNLPGPLATSTKTPSGERIPTPFSRESTPSWPNPSPTPSPAPASLEAKPLTSKCPSCGRLFKNVETYLGKRIKCSACGETFRVEAPSIAQTTPQPAVRSQTPFPAISNGTPFPVASVPPMSALGASGFPPVHLGARSSPESNSEEEFDDFPRRFSSEYLGLFPLFLAGSLIAVTIFGLIFPYETLSNPIRFVVGILVASTLMMILQLMFEPTRAIAAFLSTAVLIFIADGLSVLALGFPVVSGYCISPSPTPMELSLGEAIGPIPLSFFLPIVLILPTLFLFLINLGWRKVLVLALGLMFAWAWLTLGITQGAHFSLRESPMENLIGFALVLAFRWAMIIVGLIALRSYRVRSFMELPFYPIEPYEEMRNRIAQLRFEIRTPLRIIGRQSFSQPTIPQGMESLKSANDAIITQIQAMTGQVKEMKSVPGFRARRREVLAQIPELQKRLADIEMEGGYQAWTSGARCLGLDRTWAQLDILGASWQQAEAELREEEANAGISPVEFAELEINRRSHIDRESLVSRIGLFYECIGVTVAFLTIRAMWHQVITLPGAFIFAVLVLTPLVLLGEGLRRLDRRVRWPAFMAALLSLGFSLLIGVGVPSGAMFYNSDRDISLYGFFASIFVILIACPPGFLFGLTIYTLFSSQFSRLFASDYASIIANTPQVQRRLGLRAKAMLAILVLEFVFIVWLVLLGGSFVSDQSSGGMQGSGLTPGGFK